MDTAQQWPQGIGVVKPMESNLERKLARPLKDQALNCPRCHSSNTKFCYYNNYSLSQPRYFCKTCRRYWTEGGSLRNVPVGGGSRKNKRPSSSANSSSKMLFPDYHDINPPAIFASHHHHNQNPKIFLERQDLNLAYPSDQDYQNPCSSAMQLLKISSGMSSFMSDINLVSDNSSSSKVYSSLTTGLFPLQEFKPALNFSLLHGLENGCGSINQGVHGHGARLLFPVEDMKQQAQNNSDDQFEQNRGQGEHHTTGYDWNGMLGTGGSW